MNKLINTAIVVPFVMAAPTLMAQTPATQHQVQIQFQQNIDDVLTVVRNQQLSESQKIQCIEKYADRYLDYERISALAVGLPWRQFTPKQKKNFIVAFKAIIIGIYSHSALMGAAEAKVNLLPKIIDNGKDKVEVFTEIVTGKGNRYGVGYRLYRVANLYKIYDIRVDGSSLLTVYRNQFTDLIKQQGIDGAIATLRTRGLKNSNSSAN